MSAGRDEVRVRVPGSTSNCGAGFDTLGLAVQLYNTVTLSRRGDGPQTPSDQRAAQLVREAARRFFSTTARPAFPFAYGIAGDVPVARGLGSSVTVIAGVLAGLNALTGAGLSPHELVRLATEQEGHPDNASAGILGGFCVARCDPASNAYLDTIRFAVPDSVVCVVASPEIELLTKESRGVLPTTLPYFDAVRSINSAAYVVAAVASGDYARLRHAGGDFMHEPYRLPRIPGAQPAIAAGLRAGAYAGWLSGSGSSVLCLADRSSAPEVARGMEAAFGAGGVRSVVRLLAADNDGLRVE